VARIVGRCCGLVRCAALDLRRLLAAAEAAPPIEVVDVLAAELAEMGRATQVSLLIANVSGTAVNRLSHTTDHDALRNGRNERVKALPLDGAAYHRVLFSQTVDVVRDGDTWLVLVPVTERGDAIGVLELFLPRPSSTSSSTATEPRRASNNRLRLEVFPQSRRERGNRAVVPSRSGSVNLGRAETLGARR
jgi:hypothetical protein